jgi:hypothetical protein
MSFSRRQVCLEQNTNVKEPTMTLEGKGFYLWKIPACENGNAGAIASVAYQAGLTHVLIKIANGVYKSNYDYDQKLDLVPPVVQALKARGVQVWGWHYVYGNDPGGEARIAVQRTRELNLDGYVLDAEGEYKSPGKRNAAELFMRAHRAARQADRPQLIPLPFLPPTDAVA